MYNEFIQTPCGPLEVRATASGVTAIRFVDGGNQPVSLTEASPSAITRLACQQLSAYFAGGRDCFELPLAPAGTPFQQKVWQALCDIPYGTTCSYKDIAVAIDNPKGVRAVGLANGKNPIAIVIPCHRVIGANGRLTGYAGGLDRKATLLELEGAL